MAVAVRACAERKRKPSSRRCRSESAVESVLMQTHPQFATHFAGASGDLDQVQALLADAIEKLLESFNGMQKLIEEPAECGAGWWSTTRDMNGDS